MILIVVFGVFALHTIEIWAYAVVYLELGELGTFEQALYFSTVTFVALGYGDIVLTPNWRVLSAIEAANGVLLIAWSTAFLLSVTVRLKLLEGTIGWSGGIEERSMMVRVFALGAALLFASCTSSDPAQAPPAPASSAASASIEDGRMIAETQCASCHAIGRTRFALNRRAAAAQRALALQC